jgi:uncharacterized membrane protein
MKNTLSLLVPCAIIAVASVPLVFNWVPPNRFYGVRTRRTLSNRELWFRANRFAGRALLIAAGGSAIVFAARPDFASGRSLAGFFVLVVPLAAALLATFAYVRRADADERNPDTE